MADFDLPPSIPSTRSMVLRPFARWLLARMGWHSDGVLPDEPKLVAIVAPHTSNWDFPLGLLVKWALGLRASFLAKHTLFRPPLSWFMRRWGGIPVDRRSANNVVLGEEVGTPSRCEPGLKEPSTASKAKTDRVMPVLRETGWGFQSGLCLGTRVGSDGRGGTRVPSRKVRAPTGRLPGNAWAP